LAQFPAIEIDDEVQAVRSAESITNKKRSSRAKEENIHPINQESEQLTREYLDRLLKEQTLFQCVNPACSQIFEKMAVTQGPPERVAPDGQLLSEKHALHLQRCRYRCSSCRENFCLECKTMPYHTGKTCEEHEASLAQVRCKYCSTVVPSRSTSKDAICTSRDCIRRKNKACGRRLACGHQSVRFSLGGVLVTWLHSCDGIAREGKCLPCLKCNGKEGDFCNLCWVEDLQSAPCVQLG